MYFQASVAWIPKDLEAASDNEDAYAVSCELGIAAIADGVSSAIFSGRWAQLLTNGIVTNPPNRVDGVAWASWLAELRRIWLSEIEVNKLPWYLKPKLALGGFATLLWVEPLSSCLGGFAFRSYAIGDSCLFHVRGNSLMQRFPPLQSTDFEADPMTIGSRDRKRDHLLEFSSVESFAEPDDCLLLCTDALACWLVKQIETGAGIDWSQILSRDESAWRDAIILLRGEQEIRVDDTTIVVLRIERPEAVRLDEQRDHELEIW